MKIKKYIVSLLLCAFSSATAFSLDAQETWSPDSNLTRAKIAKYRQLVDRSPEESFAFTQMMNMAGQGAEYIKLREDYEKKVEKNPKNYNLNMILGHIYKYGKNYDLAARQYGKAAEISPVALSFEALAEAQKLNGAYEASENSYKKALDLSKNKEQKLRILEQLSENALTRRKIDEAMRYFDQALQLDPKSLFLRKTQIKLLVEAGQNDKAALAIDEAMRFAGENEKISLRFDKIDLTEKTSGADKALAEYDALAQALPRNHAAYNEVLARRARLMRELGKSDLLAQELEKLLAKNPGDTEIASLLSDIYAEKGENEKSVALAATVVRKNPKDPLAHYKYIRLLRAAGNTRSLIDAHAKRAALFPDSADFVAEYAQILFNEGEKSKAVKVLENYLSKNKSDTQFALTAADMLESQQMPEKSFAFIESAAKYNPQDIDAVESLGDYYYRRNDAPRAVKIWKRLEKLSEKDIANRELARIFAEHRYFERALEYVDKALALNRDDCESWRQKAEIHEATFDKARSADAWFSAGKYCPAMRSVAMNRALTVAKESGTLNALISDAEKNIDYADAYQITLLSRFYINNDEAAKASALLETALQKNPSEISIFHVAADLREELGDFEKAIDTRNRLADKHPAERRNALIRNAETRIRLGKIDEAKNDLAEALKIDANDEELNAKLAKLHILQNNFPEAIRYLESASRIAPNDMQLKYEVAELNALIGDYQKAHQYYVEIILDASREFLIYQAFRQVSVLADYYRFSDVLYQELNILSSKVPAKDIYHVILLDIAEQRLFESSKIKDRQARLAKIRELGKIYANPLMMSLKSASAIDRNRALRLLSKIPVASAAPALFEMIRNASSSDTVHIAAQALSLCGEPTCFEFLKKLTADTYPIKSRIMAVRGLGLVKSPQAAKLAEELLQSPHSELRAYAALSLARLGKGNLAAKIASDDPNIDVRVAALRASTDMRADMAEKLYRSHPNANTLALLAMAVGDTKNREILYAALWQNDRPTRKIAASLIRAFPKDHGVSQSLTLYELSAPTDLSPMTFLNETDKEAASEELDFDENAAKAVLRNLDAEGRKNFYYDASGHAGFFNEREVGAAEIRKIFSGSIASVRDKIIADISAASKDLSPIAAEIAELYEIREANDALKTVLKSETSPLLRSTALSALRKNRALTEAEIERYSQDPDFSVRAEALRAHKAMPADKSVKALKNALGDKSLHVRIAAAECLASIDDDDAYAALNHAVKDLPGYAYSAVVKAAYQSGIARERLKRLAADNVEFEARCSEIYGEKQ